MKDPSEPLAVSFGQGAWDLEVAHIANYSPLHWITLSNGLHYGHHLASHRQLRIAENDGDFLPTAADQEDLKMQLGDKYSINAGADFKLTRSLTFSTSYEWYWKEKDVYNGSRGRDYAALSDETNVYTETLQAGIMISSIPAFMKSEFPLPADIGLNVYLPTRGRNTPITPYGTAELALYF
jgi:hypothetical protein